MNKAEQSETTYVIVSGCNKCEPYYLVAGSLNEVVAHINKHVGGEFDVLTCMSDYSGNQWKFSVYCIPKQYTEKFYDCPSCSVEICLFVISGVANLREMMEEVEKQII